MKLYKYRTISQLEFVFDIILYKRLFCVEFEKLNDPLEGANLFAKHGKMLRDGLSSEGWWNCICAIDECRICSLSSCPDNYLMWSHYSSGFTGLVVEIDLPRNARGLKRVRYDDAAPRKNHRSIRWFVQACLSRKLPVWSYENEYRILHYSKWYALDNVISSVIVGHRMPIATKMALYNICMGNRIPMKVAFFDKGSIKISDFIPPDISEIQKDRLIP